MIYPLRDVPDKLWRAAKVRAVSEGRTMKDILIALIAEFVRHGLRKDSGQ